MPAGKYLTYKDFTLLSVKHEEYFAVMKVEERKILREFCKESVIAQQLMETQMVLAQMHFDARDYFVVINVN